MTAVVETSRAGLRDHPVARAFGSLVGAQLVAMALGYVFWLWAARSLPPAELGASTAVVNALTLLGTESAVGTPLLAAVDLPRASPAARAAFLKAFSTLVSAVGAIAGVVFWLVAVSVSPTFRLGFHSVVAVVAFLAALVATAIAQLTDQAALAFQRNAVPVLRNAATSAARFPLVLLGFVLLGHGSEAVLLGWAVASLGFVLWSLVALVPRHPERRHTLRDTVQLLRAYRSVGVRNLAFSLALGATAYVVPLVGAVALPPVRVAELGVAWLFVSIILIPPFMLANALFAGAGHLTDSDFVRTARRTLPLGLGLSALLCGGTLMLGRFALGLYGQRYADHAATLLFVLMWAGLGLVVKDHIMSVARSRGRIMQGLALAGGALACELGGAVIGVVVDGALGLAIGWLIGVSTAAVAGLPLLLSWLSRPMPVRRRQQPMLDLPPARRIA